MGVHELHLLHHHGQVPHVHVQPHVQQHVLMSQHVCQVEQEQDCAVQVLRAPGGRGRREEEEGAIRRDRTGTVCHTFQIC